MKHRLKIIRKTLGLTQQELADLVGTSLRNIQYLEKGERGIEEWAERISKALKISTWELFIDPVQIMSAADREILSRYHALKKKDKKAVDEILYGRDD